MDIFRKIALGVIIFLTIFFIHLIEYFLVNTVPFIIAFLTGNTYTPLFEFSAPGKYDYFPSI
jgi:ABC-type microcin C transport system permease subunit YejE